MMQRRKILLIGLITYIAFWAVGCAYIEQPSRVHCKPLQPQTGTHLPYHPCHRTDAEDRAYRNVIVIGGERSKDAIIGGGMKPPAPHGMAK